MEEGRVWWPPMQGRHVSMGSVMITFAIITVVATFPKVCHH
jgi:hypothetical protein